MAYKLRDERPGFHHVVTRGNNKRQIFVDDRDRAYFLTRLNTVATTHGWEILAYSLMRNHYHLLVRVGDAGLARGMCELNTSYAVAFNQRHGRINHLFGKRYWNEYLSGEGRLFNVIRYIVQNPRRAGAAGPLEAHAWTSYRASIGMALTIARFARDELLRLFGDTPAAAVDEFRSFCDASAPGDTDSSGHVRRQPP